MALTFGLKKNRKPKNYPWRLMVVTAAVTLLMILLLMAVAVSSWYAFFLRRNYGAYSYNTSPTIQLDTPPPISETIKFNPPNPNTETHFLNSSSSSSSSSSSTPPPLTNPETQSDPYHNWQLFAADFEEMMSNLKIYIYPHVYIDKTMDPFASIFLPHSNPFNPKLGNYLSEHMFKLSLIKSSLITSNPQNAHFFFLPFSINNLRNDLRVRSEASIAEFVANYTRKIAYQFPFWNASGGADHFYAHCHSVGRDAASKHDELHNNAIQVTCSSSYFQKFYVSHKDVALPQVWPRPRYHLPLNPPHERNRLVYFAGRIQNSGVRKQLMDTWGNDTSMDVFEAASLPYEEGFKKSKYCLHVRGYEVNTARISDAIHFGCIPVVLSNYYDLPFANVLDWSKFSIVINHRDIGFLKKRLLSISTGTYLKMYYNLCQVRKHFVWHKMPRGYDSFHMTAYQLWLRRNTHRLSF